MPTYIVQPGDTLTGIAQLTLNNHRRWREIADQNDIDPFLGKLFVGQRLDLPVAAVWDTSRVCRAMPGDLGPSLRTEDRPATTVPGRAFFFVLADEIDPFRRKLVRKVVFPAGLQGNTALVEQIVNPARHGFSAIDPASKVSVGRHVLGRTDSRFVSASERLMGSPRFAGQRLWIDADKVRQGGGRIVEGAEIVADLDRIAAKSAKHPAFIEYIAEIKRKAVLIDREVLIEGGVAPNAVKGAAAMGMTRGLQFVQGVGIVITAYDLSAAADRSITQHSVKPLAAETLRQAGGWGAAVAGMKVGALAGGLVGIETGPGAVVTAAVGAAIFGAAGYFGADWIADQISAN